MKLKKITEEMLKSKGGAIVSCNSVYDTRIHYDYIKEIFFSYNFNENSRDMDNRRYKNFDELVEYLGNKKILWI